MRTDPRFSNLHQWILMLLILTGFVMVMSCQKESRGFVLPDGNIDAGKVAFAKLYCTDCHSIGDVAWTGNESNGDVHVTLGGEVTALKSYGELVTSVINPSHKISQRNLVTQPLQTPEGASRMEARCYNDIMTVQELVDIVAFLQSKYQLVLPTNPYPYK